MDFLTGFAKAVFQSTLSVRRATEVVEPETGHVVISIHALRKESDLSSAAYAGDGRHFNPRSP